MMRKLALVGGLMAVGLITAQSLAGIANTPHNLSSSGPGTIKASTNPGGTDEICVFCHTPHNANNEAFEGAPLWNKFWEGGAPPTYTMYGSTIAGNSTDTEPSASSKACLACHDGVNAINSVYNAPGSGGSGGGTYILMDGQTSATAFPMPTTSAANLGTDLSDDHPVSIQYIAGNASLKDPDTTTLTGWVGATTIRDLLRGPSRDRVECGSCHDPHTDINPLFLRKDNGGSALCLGCHDK